MPNEINLKAVAATVAQGLGYRDHEYVFENIGIPTMTRKTWEKYEKMFGDRMEWVQNKHICVLLFYCCSTNTCIYINLHIHTYVPHTDSKTRSQTSSRVREENASTYRRNTK